MKIYNKFISNILSNKSIKKYLQKHGFELIKSHYYSPLPDLNEIRNNSNYLNNSSKMAGIKLDAEGQLDFLSTFLPLYYDECCQININKTNSNVAFNFDNQNFGFQPAIILYSIIRHLKPKNIIEVGAGNSTLLSASASNANKKDGYNTTLTTIEPYPHKYISTAIQGLDKVIQKKLQDVEISFFEQLNENDILFIDSSHVVQANSDVSYLFLEILPTLKKGVYIHFHDIFLPYNYPREWYLDNEYYWTEQYLLQAFLCFNSNYEVVLSNYYLDQVRHQELNTLIPKPCPIKKNHYQSSFWIRKI